MISAIIPTRDRALVLERTLNSLLLQGQPPAELIVIDASSDSATRKVVEAFRDRAPPGQCKVLWQAANEVGAAVQRNQGFKLASHSLIAFFDDDILFEPDCLARLAAPFDSDMALGGVSAMITNQRYSPPGSASRFLYRLMGGGDVASYAGRVLGPAVNLLPEDREDLPDVVSVEWLNTTCTVYRRDALHDPPFEPFFTGYSMMEDLALSLTVGRRWRLANARTARIFHDSQPGVHKNDPVELSRMELTNRHFVMTRIMERRGFEVYLRLAVWEAFQLTVCMLQHGPAAFLTMSKGKLLALADLMNPTPERSRA